MFYLNVKVISLFSQVAFAFEGKKEAHSHFGCGLPCELKVIRS